MWGFMMDNIPDTITTICTILAFVIPYVIYKVNQWLHFIGDPAWKKPGTHSRDH